MMLYTYESWWTHQIFQRSYHKWLFWGEKHILNENCGKGLWWAKTSVLCIHMTVVFFLQQLPLIMKFIKTGLTMAPFPGHLGMRLCSNLMRHVSVYCTPKTELLIHALLCVKSVHIVHCQSHCNTASTCTLPLLELIIRMMVLCQEDYDFSFIPKVYTCMYVYNTLV